MAHICSQPSLGAHFSSFEFSFRLQKPQVIVTLSYNDTEVGYDPIKDPVSQMRSAICNSLSPPGSAWVLWNPHVCPRLAQQSSNCSIHSPVLSQITSCWTTWFPLALKGWAAALRALQTPTKLLHDFKKIPCRHFSKKKKEKQIEGSCSQDKASCAENRRLEESWGISGAVSAHLTFLSSNEASREISDIPQKGTIFSPHSTPLFASVPSWQPSPRWHTAVVPSLLCSAGTFRRGDGAAGSCRACAGWGVTPSPSPPTLLGRAGEHMCLSALKRLILLPRLSTGKWEWGAEEQTLAKQENEAHIRNHNALESGPPPWMWTSAYLH